MNVYGFIYRGEIDHLISIFHPEMLYFNLFDENYKVTEIDKIDYDLATIYIELTDEKLITSLSKHNLFTGKGTITQKDDVYYVTPHVKRWLSMSRDHDVPYFAINVPNDTCNDCGYTGVIENTCPCCNSDNISRLRRVAAYLPRDHKTAFNKGKQQEVEQSNDEHSNVK